MKKEKDRKKGKMKNFHKTLLITGIICLIVIIGVVYVQLTAQKDFGNGCSYLDPITIDVLAFIAGLFLVSEGFDRIFEHKDAKFSKQYSRIARIALGCAIVTIHTLQFIHK